MVNMEKEDIVAKKKRVCYGAKCHNKWRKCKYVGKIIKVFKKHSCAVHSYGNKSSRRKLCCQWENYCTGIRKFKCRPINKKCHWVGKVHQRIPKYVCKWEKKTRHSKQKYCCKWLRSCVSRKRKFQRNCTDGPKKMQMGRNDYQKIN